MTLTNKNTEQLVELCKDGNQLAQLEIYNRYYKAMYNTALRIVKDSFEAEDVMQESFLMAFTKLSSLKDSKMFGAWLKRIVVNGSIYNYKKSIKFQDVPLESVEYKLQQSDEDTENEEAFNSLKASELLESMNSLKDNYRIALNLYLVEGYDYEEISEIMNISYANSRTTISRAKQSLKQKLLASVI